MKKQIRLGKKKFLLGFISLMLVISMAAGCANTATGQADDTAGKETIELSLAHFFPATHPAETELVKGWAAAVNEATNGRVVITSYPGESLFKAADIYQNVVEGGADIGLSCFAYNAGRFPIMEAFEQPGVVYKNSKVASKVAWEGIKQLNPEEVQDTHLMMVIATGSGDLFTVRPVRTLGDIQGMQIRATGLSAQTLELLGAVPVGMPQSETYEALSKGVVAGNLSPDEVLKTWNHADICKYITQTPFLYNTLFYVTMNLDTWNSLSPELQEAITAATEAFIEETAIGLWDSMNQEALDWAINDKGIEVIPLSDEEMAQWISLVEPLQAQYVEKNGEASAVAMETVKRLADHYNEVY